MVIYTSFKESSSFELHITEFYTTETVLTAIF